MKFVGIAAVLAAGALAGCGDEPRPAAPAKVTPVPSTRPLPTPTAQIHEGDGTPSPAPSPEPTPARVQAPEDEGGDEAGNRVPVSVRVGRRRIRASDDVVPAFLALRLRITNRLGRRLRVVVVRSGEGGAAIGALTVSARGSGRIDLDGLQPGRLEVLSPDLDPDMTAILRVEPGAG